MDVYEIGSRALFKQVLKRKNLGVTLNNYIVGGFHIVCMYMGERKRGTCYKFGENASRSILDSIKKEVVELLKF